MISLWFEGEDFELHLNFVTESLRQQTHLGVPAVFRVKYYLTHIFQSITYSYVV